VGNCNQWVAENVLPLLGPPEERKKRNTIRDEITSFIGGDLLAEFWGDCCGFDFVVFTWIFGKMVDLPSGYPYYFNDIRPLINATKAEMPQQESGLHNALADARWIRHTHEILTRIDLPGHHEDSSHTSHTRSCS